MKHKKLRKQLRQAYADLMTLQQKHIKQNEETAQLIKQLCEAQNKIREWRNNLEGIEHSANAEIKSLRNRIEVGTNELYDYKKQFEDSRQMYIELEQRFHAVLLKLTKAQLQKHKDIIWPHLSENLQDAQIKKLTK